MKKIIISVALLGSAITAVQANFVVNGDFSLSVPRNSTGNGWTTLNIDGAGGWSGDGGNPTGMFILNDNGNGSSDPTIFQDISLLVIGQTYSVSGDLAVGNSASANNKDFGVEIDGHVWEYEIPRTRTWMHWSETFVASASTLRLQMTGERHGDSDPAIDNISLVAVPEPATLSALAIGAFGFLRRRKS